MIRCNKCGYIGAYVGRECTACKEAFDLTPNEIEEKTRELREAERKKQRETVAELNHLFADLGSTESQLKYADMLERGIGTVRDLDTAMTYYYMAAEKNNPTGAYRYSRLAQRTSDRAAIFWLEYSAALGCVESYLHVANRYADRKEDELANYYYAMASVYDVTDAIVTLAKRYYTGVGQEQHLPYAKWYMDKLLLPPIHAIKMAYKLRSVKAEDPGIPTHPDFRRMLRRLAIRAKDCGFERQYHHLCTMLDNEGDVDARMVLGVLHAEGRGCEQDTALALSFLESAASDGSVSAYRYLGDLYISNTLLPRDTDKALGYYRSAAELGMTNAYETMGDIFREGKIVTRDVARAIELYDLAAKEGHSEPKKKADKLKAEREELFRIGVSVKENSPTQSFKALAISSGMGYVPAYKEMARSFLDGIGIKKDRRQAHLWFVKAVEAGDNDALFELGLCYSRGIGTSFDFKKATDTLAKATRLGNKDAKEELERILNNKRKNMLRKVYSKAMSLVYQKKLESAVDLLCTCEKFGHARGIYTLGCLNEFGLGTPTNRGRAFELYERSFDLKFRDPRAVYKLQVLKMARL
jgi:TPR repeat protein